MSHNIHLNITNKR